MVITSNSLSKIIYNGSLYQWDEIGHILKWDYHALLCCSIHFSYQRSCLQIEQSSITFSWTFHCSQKKNPTKKEQKNKQKQNETNKSPRVNIITKLSLIVILKDIIANFKACTSWFKHILYETNSIPLHHSI